MFRLWWDDSDSYINPQSIVKKKTSFFYCFSRENAVDLFSSVDKRTWLKSKNNYITRDCHSEKHKIKMGIAENIKQKWIIEFREA